MFNTLKSSISIFSKSILKKIVIKLVRRRKRNQKVESKIYAVIICGTGRSGTSMLRTYLSKKLYMHSPPENFATLRIILVAEILIACRLKFLAPLIIPWIFINTADHKITWKVSYQTLKEKIRLIDDKNFSSENILLAINKSYIEPQGFVIDYFFDKTPNNTKHLEILKEIFPKLKLLHLVRNPCDVLNSYTSSKHHKFPSRTPKFFENKWITSNDDILIQKKTMEYLLIRYEDFISNQDEEFEKIKSFLKFPVQSKLKKKFHFGDLEFYPHHQNSLLGKLSRNPNFNVSLDSFLDKNAVKKLSLHFGYKIID